MSASEDRPVEEKGSAHDWSSSSSTGLGDLFGENTQTVVTIAVFAAVILAFLGICVPLFLM
jgi:hypothetical protein